MTSETEERYTPTEHDKEATEIFRQIIGLHLRVDMNPQGFADASPKIGYVDDMCTNILTALSSAGLQITRGWQPIETAPKDGTKIRYQSRTDHKVRFEGECEWRRFIGDALHDPMTGVTYVGPVDEMRWMYPLGEHNKCVPTPTHWLPSPPQTPEDGEPSIEITEDEIIIRDGDDVVDRGKIIYRRPTEEEPGV